MFGRFRVVGMNGVQLRGLHAMAVAGRGAAGAAVQPLLWNQGTATAVSSTTTIPSLPPSSSLQESITSTLSLFFVSFLFTYTLEKNSESMYAVSGNFILTSRPPFCAPFYCTLPLLPKQIDVNLHVWF